MTELGPLAAALAQTVARSRGQRVLLSTLRDDAHRADLSLAGSAEARDRLAEAFAQLEAAGLVTAPKTAAGWDRTVRPPLPRYLQRVRPPAPDPVSEPRPRREVVWHARLSWVPAFLAEQNPTAVERRLLDAVQQALSSGMALTVPLRERSLQLLGDEKALDAMTRGSRLFTVAGRLSLELLGAERLVLPLISLTVGPGPDVLVVENYTTFVTLGRLLPAAGNVGMLIWGAGNQVTQMLPQLAVAPSGALLYFGDLDVRGLEIGAAATQTSIELGLPQLCPSTHLYRLLLRHGMPAPVSSRRPSPDRVDEAVRWLPKDLRTAAANMLGSGDRVAQEAVGVDVLRNHTWPAHLA